MQNFKKNFSNGNNDISCKFGCENFDSQKHSLNCTVIKEKFPDLSVTTIQYNDLFSSDVTKIKQIVSRLSQVYKLREALIARMNIDKLTHILSA